MRSIRLITLLMILLPVTVQGQEASNGWKEVIVSEGGFAITLPDGVMRDKRYMGDGNDTRMGDRIRAVNDALIFEASFSPLSAEEAKQKREIVSNMTISKVHPGWGDALCQTKFKINGYPAVETLFRHRPGGYFRLREVVTNTRHYYLVVESKDRDGSVQAVRSAEAERFLNSFVLIDKKTQ